MSNLESRGTRAQTQIKEDQIKKIRKGQKGKESVDGGGVGWGVTSIKAQTSKH